MTFTSRRLNEGRWQAAVNLASHWQQTNVLPCVTVATGSENGLEGWAQFGGRQFQIAGQEMPDIYLVASITKPIVAMAAVRLIEIGALTLVDRIAETIPEFGHAGKYGIELRHLLTHTSGLPDMLPDNVELRRAHASVTRFMQRTCEEPLAFPPGRGVQYQSMGFAMLGEIIARTTGKNCAQYLRDEFFQPLGMHDAALGAPDTWFEGRDSKISRVPDVVLPEGQVEGDDWNWNSRYWQQLGAPWGGLLISAHDLARYAQFMLRGGVSADGHRILSPAAIAMATRNQLESMRDVPEVERRCRPWGLGWRLDWPAHSANFGDLLGPRSYGHWGATGTVLWIDPDAGTFGIVLTTQPQEPSGPYLARLSNAIAAAWE